MAVKTFRPVFIGCAVATFITGSLCLFTIAKTTVDTIGAAIVCINFFFCGWNCFWTGHATREIELQKSAGKS